LPRVPDDWEDTPLGISTTLARAHRAKQGWEAERAAVHLHRERERPRRRRRPVDFLDYSHLGFDDNFSRAATAAYNDSNLGGSEISGSDSSDVATSARVNYGIEEHAWSPNVYVLASLKRGRI
jgi:hypothetical protein